MPYTIRTTNRPDIEITVSDREYADLLAQGLVFGEAEPAPADPGDVEIQAFIEDETSLTHAALRAALVPAEEGAKTRRLGVYQGRPSLNDTIASMESPPTVAVTGPSATGPITGTTTTQSTNRVSRREGRYATSTINGVQYHNNRINDPSTARSPVTIEFTFSGVEFAVKFLNQFAETSGVRVIVDGQLAGSYTSPAGSTTSEPYWARVTFAASSVRRIRLEFLTGAIFGGLNFAAGATATPIPDRLPRCAMYGDSYVGGALSVADANLYYYQLGRELGWEVARLGHGGSGYAQDGSGAGVEYENATRVAELITYQPDFVVVVGSINNDATSPAAITAAATSLYDQIATGVPQARVFVVGPQSTGDTVPAGRLLARDAVQAAAAAAPNVISFIDPIAEQWITGTGREGATTGDGNADTWVGTDGSHLTIVGHKGYANLTAKAILRAA